VEFGHSPFGTSPEDVRERLLELMELARTEAGLPAPAAAAGGKGNGAGAADGAAAGAARLIDYAEISGAGRTVYDAREAACLAAVYGGGLASPNPSQENGGNGEIAAAAAAAAAPVAPGDGLVVGCIKSNLGHMDAASGMAGLLKALLVLQHKAAPPQPRLAQGPHQEFLSLGVQVPTGGRLVPIAPVGNGAAPARPLRVAVTSLAWSGTNAHVLVEECAAPAAGGEEDDGVESMLAHDDDEMEGGKKEEEEGVVRKRALPPLEMRRRPFPWWHVDHAPPPPPEPEEEDDDEGEGDALSQDSEATQRPRAPKYVRRC
jgi:hypothetical protein